MKKKQHLFIYDHKEMIVLSFLGLTVASFAFTLGIHLGKRIIQHSPALVQADPKTVRNLPDALLNRQEWVEQEKNASSLLEEALNEELQAEVIRSALKIDTPRQIDLPEKSISLNGGATTLFNSKQSGFRRLSSLPEVQESSLKVSSKKENLTLTKYTLQIGSFPTLEEAQKEYQTLKKRDLKSFLKQVDLKDKGKWYRLCLGEFPTRILAEKAGALYKSQHKITQFMVSKLLD